MTSAGFLSQKSAVETLSDDILKKIFNWLPSSTKIIVLPVVCKRWRMIAADPIVFPTTFDFTHSMTSASMNKSMNFIIDAIYEKENIPPRILYLPLVTDEATECGVTVNLLKTGSSLGMWKSLTKLSAHKTYSDIDKDTFSNFISSLNSEVFTEITINWMTPDRMSSICQNLKKLQRLLIHGQIDAETLQHLVNDASDLNYLRELHLHLQKSTANIMEDLLKIFKDQLELLTLQIHDIHIDTSFLKSLGLCHNLTYLNIWAPGVMKYDDLGRALFCMTQLEQLHLTTGRFTDRIEDSLFQELNNLRHIFLHMRELEDEDVANLCVNNGRCLETIHLEWCSELTESAIASIAAYCNNLVVLKLRHCWRVDKAKLLEKLAENPGDDLPQLVLLNLSWDDDKNEIPADVLSNCLAARPQLFIKTRDRLVDEFAVSAVLQNVLGANYYHRKQLFGYLLS